MARVRRTFTPEFKRDAVRLVEGEGKTVSEVARNLGITRSLLRPLAARYHGKIVDETGDGEFPRKVDT